MKDILQAFREYDLSAHGAGASTEEIDAAQQELNVRFPEDYRLFLCTLGWAVSPAVELNGIGSDVPAAWDVRLITKTLREESGLPPFLIPISRAFEEGAFVCLDCRDAAVGVCGIVRWSCLEQPGSSLDVLGQRLDEWLADVMSEDPISEIDLWEVDDEVPERTEHPRLAEFITTCQEDLRAAADMLREDPDLLRAQCEWTGETALCQLAIENEVEAVRFLLGEGADVDAQTDFGTTPLVEAACAMDREMCMLLMAHGADPNACGSDGLTPLHVAAEFNWNGGVIEALRAAGADPCATDELARTPADCAASGGRLKLAEKLRAVARGGIDGGEAGE